MEIIDVNTLFGFWPRREADFSLGKLLEVMRKHKVKRCFSLSMRGIFYDYEEGNRETLEVSKKHSEIVPVATIDLRKYFGNKDILKVLIDQGFKGLRLFPDLQDWPFQGWPFDYQPFLEIVGQMVEGFPLMVSITGLGKMTAIGRITSESGIPVIVTGVTYWCFAEALAVMNQYENVYIETSLFSSPDSYELFVQKIGAERIIFGSYSPIHYFSSFFPLQKAQIGEREKQLILHENIERFLK